MYTNTTNFEGVRQTNRGKVLTLIHESPGIDRTEIASSVGITNAAITNIVLAYGSIKMAAMFLASLFWLPMPASPLPIYWVR
jgi:hypothetical protein